MFDKTIAYILGIGGSPRKNGNSAIMLEAFIQGAADAGARTRVFYLRETTVHSCIGCEKCRRDKKCTRLLDGMQDIYPEIDRAGGLVLASPAHNYNVTALTKAFIDRMYCYYDFTNDRPRGWSSRLAGQGRKAAIIGVAEQAGSESMGLTMEAMRLPLAAHGYDVSWSLEGYLAFDRGEIRKQPDILERAAQIGHTMAQCLGAQSGGGASMPEKA